MLESTPHFESEVFSFLNGARDPDLHHDDWWKVNNSSFRDYSRRAKLLGCRGGLRQIIDTQIVSGEDNVGLDIAAGAKARALRNLLDSGVLRSALATNYKDRRPRRIVKDSRLEHIDGDLTDPATWRKIVEWKNHNAPHGFTLAMHRPVGGLQHLPNEIYRGAAHLVVDLVKPGGLLFTQVPRNLASDQGALVELCAEIQERPDVAEVITSPPKSPYAHIDKADLYAVVFKSPTA